MPTWLKISLLVLLGTPLALAVLLGLLYGLACLLDWLGVKGIFFWGR